jgi:hypothetical protein
MSYVRSGTFWSSAIVGWFVTMIALAVMLSIFGSDQMTTGEGIMANVVIQVLSVAAGYAHGRHQWKSRKPNQAGFPVIPKDGGGPAVG